MDDVSANLGVLVEAMGLGFARNAHAGVPVQLDLLSGEQLVDLLQGEVLRLGVPAQASAKLHQTRGWQEWPYRNQIIGRKQKLKTEK